MTSKKYLVLIFMIKISNIGFAQNVSKTINRLSDTGVNTSYTNTIGEDNDYNTYTQFFVNNGNVTTTDTVTSLMWQRTDGGEMTVENARIYVDSLTLAGHTNWRLPTYVEATTILNMDKNNPALDVLYFPNTGAEYWWTSNVQFNDAAKVFCTNSGGGIGPHPKTETISAGGAKKFHVRAVRDVTTPLTILRYTDNGDNTITDNLTNITWQKSTNPDTLTWEQALIYAEGASTAGFTDWRLPNHKELSSLTDVTRNAPSINTTFFSTVKSNRYWSSTTQKGQSANAWFTDFANNGITSYFAKTKAYNVILVRGGIYSKPNAIQDIADEITINIYPNPSPKTFHITSQETIDNLMIYNTLGQLIFTAHPLVKDYTFSLEESGIYYVRLLCSGKVMVRGVRVE
jgi:Protein of unknown function (DUF1566)